MFKKLLASMGAGSAQVDTRLVNDRVVPGGTLRGEVHITGGAVPQEIEEVSLFLMTQVEVESGDSEYRQNFVISRAPLARDFRVGENERLSIPFEMYVHLETPVTALSSQDWSSSKLSYTHSRPHHGRGAKVWLDTGLEIDNGVDSTDRDALIVEPTPPMQRILSALEELGFRMVSADVEKGTLRGKGFQSTAGFYQEIEFRPQHGSYARRINELELSFVPRVQDTGVLIEVDRRFSSRDSYRSLLMNHGNFERVDWVRELSALLGSI
ncbi:sporulation protein [Archangium minus]|uniref:Sporulation protein n=1 Tax=Archangium minus TaxID=83450 RepID=A0ABY9WII8_9BACT|nr:sporulation protein [Archangium minus]